MAPSFRGCDTYCLASSSLEDKKEVIKVMTNLTLDRPRYNAWLARLSQAWADHDPEALAEHVTCLVWLNEPVVKFLTLTK